VDGRLRLFVYSIAMARRISPTILATAAAGLVLVSAVSSPAANRYSAPKYKWTIDDEDGPNVQFGVPDTDDRAIRLACGPQGQISVMGPAETEGPEGAKISVTFRGVAQTTAHIGEVGYAGDGFNFEVIVDPSDDAIVTLLTGRDLMVVQGANTWMIPGNGAAKVLKPMLHECARRAIDRPKGVVEPSNTP
jgi:hypothetical protein